MPIDRDDFDAGESLAVRPGTNKHRVLTFLAANDEQAFMRSEVAEGAGIDPDSTGPVLSRLRDEGFVEYRDGYWAIERDEELGFLADFLHELDDLAEEFEVSDLPDWIRG